MYIFPLCVFVWRLGKRLFLCGWGFLQVFADLRVITCSEQGAGMMSDVRVTGLRHWLSSLADWDAFQPTLDVHMFSQVTVWVPVCVPARIVRGCVWVGISENLRAGYSVWLCIWLSAREWALRWIVREFDRYKWLNLMGALRCYNHIRISWKKTLEEDNTSRNVLLQINMQNTHRHLHTFKMAVFRDAKMSSSQPHVFPAIIFFLSLFLASLSHLLIYFTIFMFCLWGLFKGKKEIFPWLLDFCRYGNPTWEAVLLSQQLFLRLSSCNY